MPGGHQAHTQHSRPAARPWQSCSGPHLAGVCVEAHVLGGEANLSARVAHHLLVVDLGRGGDLAKDHDHVGLAGGLTGHLQAGGRLIRVDGALRHGCCICCLGWGTALTCTCLATCGGQVRPLPAQVRMQLWTLHLSGPGALQLHQAAAGWAAAHLGRRVLCQAGIQDSVRHLRAQQHLGEWQACCVRGGRPRLRGGLTWSHSLSGWPSLTAERQQRQPSALLPAARRGPHAR